MTSELTLDRVQWVDEGIYSCLAKQVESNDEPTKQEIILEIFGKFLFINLNKKKLFVGIQEKVKSIG